MQHIRLISCSSVGNNIQQHVLISPSGHRKKSVSMFYPAHVLSLDQTVTNLSHL